MFKGQGHIAVWLWCQIASKRWHPPPVAFLVYRKQSRLLSRLSNIDCEPLLFPQPSHSLCPVHFLWFMLVLPIDFGRVSKDLITQVTHKLSHANSSYSLRKIQLCLLKRMAVEGEWGNRLVYWCKSTPCSTVHRTLLGLFASSGTQGRWQDTPERSNNNLAAEV